mgnify:FL=1|jgi:hypothetical protein|tara:strand:+ start:2349 stop:3089 length:741 start_codon:yes stop_codon:yes gene_type:complete
MKKFRHILEGVDTVNENLSSSSKELAKEIDTAARKESGSDKTDYQTVAKLISQNKLKDAKKIIAKLDTVVLEDLITFIMGHEDVFKAMYPRARPGQYAASFARKESVEEGTLPPALQAYQDKKNGKKPKDDEKEVEEAMSPADKAKRLKMIKQAVEKMNKSNMERAKKDALRMMKDSGMFDEELEEAAPKMKKLGFYGSEIGGLRQGNKYYSAKPVEVKGKVGFRVTDEFGGFETIDLKTFAKRFG